MAKKDKPGKNPGSQPTGPAPYWDGEKWVLPQQEPVKPPPPPTGPTPYWDGEKWVLPQPGQNAPAPEPVADPAPVVATPVAEQPVPTPEPAATAQPEPARVQSEPAAPQREVVYVQAKRKGVKGLVAILVLQCLILLAGLTTLALVLFNVQLPVPELGAIGGSAPQEVTLQAAASVGTVPFLEKPFAATIDKEIAQPALVEPPEDGVTLTVQPVVADTPFLYGVDATPAEQWCDRDGLSEALAADTDKAQLWVDALSIDPTVDTGDDALTPGDLAATIASFGRVVLTRDTRVTLHGLTAEGVEAVQAVLQKGSWVLVDRAGLPRVTCNGANPLTAAAELEGSARFTGAAWPDLDPAALVEVVAGDFQVAAFNVRSPANDSGDPRVQNAPWFEVPTPPSSGFTCAPGIDVNQGGGPVATLTVTNGADVPIVLFAVDFAVNGTCAVKYQAALNPGNGMSYPYPGDANKWVPWVNTTFFATSLDGEILWEGTIKPADKGTEVVWSIS